ncbi:MAG: glycine-rich domain-containing protein [Telluria sp.]
MISSNDTPMLFPELDLDPIKEKLMHESGEGWSAEQADAVEVEYRRFLYLMKMFPTEETAPLVEVDVFWHYHILDTMKYAADCEQVFGHFLHHFPYVGMRGEGDDAVREQAGDRMRELYEQTFGDGYGAREDAGKPPHGAAGNALQQAWCGVAAKAIGKRAWCGVAKPGDVKLAWCGVASKAANDKLAWCGVASKAANDKLAWCGVASKAANDKLAWCGVAKPSDVKLAWCGVASKTANDKLAWCGVASKAANDKTAWCGVAKPGDVKLAWCGVATKAVNDKLAWCGVASKAANDKLAWCGVAVKATCESSENGESYSEAPALLAA